MLGGFGTVRFGVGNGSNWTFVLRSEASGLSAVKTTEMP